MLAYIDTLNAPNLIQMAYYTRARSRCCFLERGALPWRLVNLSVHHAPSHTLRASEAFAIELCRAMRRLKRSLVQCAAQAVQDQEEQWRGKRKLGTWFLPMRNPKKEHMNPTLQQYWHWHLLPEAPVSDAAKVRSCVAVLHLVLADYTWFLPRCSTPGSCRLRPWCLPPATGSRRAGLHLIHADCVPRHSCTRPLLTAHASAVLPPACPAFARTENRKYSPGHHWGLTS